MTRITCKIAHDRYGVLTGGVNSLYRYYLQDDGSVVDSDGDVRYSPPPHAIHLCSCGAQVHEAGAYCNSCVPF